MIEINYIKGVLDKYPNVYFDDGIKNDILNILEKNYANRHYHSLTHIVSCLKNLEKIISVREKTSHPLTKIEQEYLVSAILFHDIIYGEKKDVSDEKMSALLFEEFISPYSKNQDYIASVKELILSTEHLKEDFTPNYVSQHLVDLMADIDLSILSSSINNYRVYSQNVRKEYAYVPDIEFAKGRIKILVSLSKKAEDGVLYRTKDFMSKNKKALININNEIKELKESLENLEIKKPKI